jgi:hypothetical protein
MVACRRTQLRGRRERGGAASEPGS